jgi:hypothetical protein
MGEVMDNETTVSADEDSILRETGVAADAAERVNLLLATCAPEDRHKFEETARRALYGPASRKWAMRLKCLECTAWQIAEVARCEIKGCALWTFRAGSGETLSAPKNDPNRVWNVPKR